MNYQGCKRIMGEKCDKERNPPPPLQRSATKLNLFCEFFNNLIYKQLLSFMYKVTCSVLSVGALSVSSLLHDVFFTAWEHDVWRESGMVCRMQQQ